MDIAHWLIGLVVLALIAAFARQQGEIRLEQRPGPMDAGDGGPYASPAVIEAQPRGVMSEDQQELKELLDARTNIQDQLDILGTRSRHGGPAAERLRAILKEIDERIEELQSDRA